MWKTGQARIVQIKARNAQKMITHNWVDRKLVGRLIVNIAPETVTNYLGRPSGRASIERFLLRHIPSGRVRQKSKRLIDQFRSGLFLEETGFSRVSPWESTSHAMLIHDFIAQKGDFQKSEWFLQMHAKLEKNGVVFWKSQPIRTAQELENFFLMRVTNLCETMAKSGYDFERGEKAGQAAIDLQGRLVKGSHGRHRFGFARELKVSRVPLRIRWISRDWFQEQTGAAISRKNVVAHLPRLISEIEVLHQLPEDGAQVGVQ